MRTLFDISQTSKAKKAKKTDTETNMYKKHTFNAEHAQTLKKKTLS